MNDAFEAHIGIFKRYRFYIEMYASAAVLTVGGAVVCLHVPQVYRISEKDSEKTGRVSPESSCLSPVQVGHILKTRTTPCG